MSYSASAVIATTIISNRNFVFAPFPLLPVHDPNKNKASWNKISLFPVFQRSCVPVSLSAAGKPPKPQSQRLAFPQRDAIFGGE